MTQKTQPTGTSAEANKVSVNDRSSSKVMIPDEIFANADYEHVRNFNLTDQARLAMDKDIGSIHQPNYPNQARVSPPELQSQTQSRLKSN